MVVQYAFHRMLSPTYTVNALHSDSNCERKSNLYTVNALHSDSNCERNSIPVRVSDA